MSSNLLKYGYTNLQQSDKRIIDTNTLVEKRIEELAKRISPSPKPQMTEEETDGFVSGLMADEIEVNGLVAGEQADAETSGNVIKDNAEDVEKIVSRANEEARAIVEMAQKESVQILESARQKAKQEKVEMLASARKQGYDEGKRQAEEELASQQQELHNKARQLEADYQKKIEELEPMFVDTITGVYEHIFHVELGSYREILVYLIESTIRNVEGGREFIVHVSKEDYPFVSMQKKQIMSGTPSTNSTVEVIEDLTLDKNECLIETEGGIFDCGLGTQMEELGRKLRLLAYGK